MIQKTNEDFNQVLSYVKNSHNSLHYRFIYVKNYYNNRLDYDLNTQQTFNLNKTVFYCIVEKFTLHSFVL